MSLTRITCPKCGHAWHAKIVGEGCASGFWEQSDAYCPECEWDSRDDYDDTEDRIAAYEADGMTRSDAQAVVEAEDKRVQGMTDRILANRQAHWDKFLTTELGQRFTAAFQKGAK